MAMVDQDEEHLKLLVIFHYIWAGCMALFALFPIFHLLMGLGFVFLSHSCAKTDSDCPPEFMGYIFAVFAALLILFGFALAALIFFAGRFMARRQHHLFCLIVSGLECISFPFGTILGILSLMVLSRESVKALFQNIQLQPQQEQNLIS